jgi:hypothetical protein
VTVADTLLKGLAPAIPETRLNGNKVIVVLWGLPGRAPVRNCGIRNYDNIDRAKVNVILKALIDHGSLVLGNNPWNVDTRKHGVLLQGIWDEEASMLSLTVTDADWYVPREKIWENIDSLMQAVHKPG